MLVHGENRYSTPPSPSSALEDGDDVLVLEDVCRQADGRASSALRSLLNEAGQDSRSRPTFWPRECLAEVPTTSADLKFLAISSEGGQMGF